MEQLYLAPGINFIYYTKKKTGFIFNNKNRKEYFLNYTASKILKDLLERKYEKLNKSTLSYINSLKQKGLLTNCSINSGVYRIIDTNIPLQSVQLEISKRCNLRCSHCYISNYSIKQDMSLQQIKHIINSANELGVINFDITGGEPFLNKNIIDILEYITLKGMRTTIFTNGTVLNDNILMKLQNINIFKMKISIDGYDEYSHDQIRGKGAYKKTINNIKKLKKANMNLEVNTVLNKKNYKMSKKIINTLEKLNIPYHIDRYVPYDGNLLDPLCIKSY